MQMNYENMTKAELISKLKLLESSVEISKNSELESTLKELQEKYRTLFEILNDAIFKVDVETGLILDVNRHAEALLGIPTEEIIGMHYTRVHPLEEEKRNKKLFEKYAKISKSLTSEEIFVQHKDGRKIPVEISTSIFNSGGRKAILGVLRDITKRKETEAGLRKLSRAVTQSPSMIVITDINGNIEYVNPKLTALTGYTFEEVIGKNPRIWKSGNTPPEEYKSLWTTIKSGAEWRGEFCNKKKNGELFWESISISSVKDEKGVITHFAGVKEDITERKKTDEILQQQKNSLEQKNIALSEVLGQIELEKRQIKDNLIASAESLLLPIIQKLMIKEESRNYAQLLQKNVQELTSTFGVSLNKKKDKLTSREIEICNMIKNGLTSKEIASISNSSLRTTEKHRSNIRRKLRIVNKKTNLSSYLKRL